MCIRDRSSHCLREYGRIEGDSIGTIQSIAARAAHIDHTHFINRLIQKLRNDAPGWISRLCCRPYGCTLRINFGHRARCANGSVHLVRIGVLGPDDHARGSEFGLGVPGVNAKNIVGRLFLEILEEAVLRRKLRSRIPLDRQLPGRQSCLVLSLGHDTNKILTDDDLHQTWNTVHRSFVHMRNSSPHLRRPYDSSVQHPRDPSVVNELELTSHQGGSVQRRDWFTEHRPIWRRSPLRGRA